MGFSVGGLDISCYLRFEIHTGVKVDPAVLEKPDVDLLTISLLFAARDEADHAMAKELVSAARESAEN